MSFHGVPRDIPLSCAQCDKEGPLEAFGLCKACYNRRYYSQNREVFRIYNKKYHEEHRTELLAYKREWYLEHREEQLAQKKVYRLENLEQIKEKYRTENYSRRWRKNNPEKAKKNNQISMARRRARKLSLPQTLTGKEIKGLLTIKHCFYCVQEVVGPVLDHFVPLAAKNNQACGTTLANIIISCRSCNSKKGSKLPQEILFQKELVF